MNLRFAWCDPYKPCFKIYGGHHQFAVGGVHQPLQLKKTIELKPVCLNSQIIAMYNRPNVRLNRPILKEIFFNNWSKSMTQYCITAANHKNRTDHRASEFELWEYFADKKKSLYLGATPIDVIVKLLVDGKMVFSAEKNQNIITIGEPIEIELRIAHNKSGFKISDMPTF